MCSVLWVRLRLNVQDDVAGRDGKQALADSIKDALNIFLEDKEGFGGVEGIHFTSFVLQ